MKITRKKENYTITVNTEELTQIWASLLYMRSQHKDIEMYTTDKLIKIFTNWLKAPF